MRERGRRRRGAPNASPSASARPLYDPARPLYDPSRPRARPERGAPRGLRQGGHVPQLRTQPHGAPPPPLPLLLRPPAAAAAPPPPTLTPAAPNRRLVRRHAGRVGPASRGGCFPRPANRLLTPIAPATDSLVSATGSLVQPGSRPRPQSTAGRPPVHAPRATQPPSRASPPPIPARRKEGGPAVGQQADGPPRDRRRTSLSGFRPLSRAA